MIKAMEFSSNFSEETTSCICLLLHNVYCVLLLETEREELLNFMDKSSFLKWVVCEDLHQYHLGAC